MGSAQLNVLPPPGPRARLPAPLRALASFARSVTRTRREGPLALHDPLFVSWEINSVCNLRCPYCYLHDRSYGFTDRGLDFEEMKPVLHRIEAVCPDVMLLGGEPFLHPSWDDIVDYCRDALGLRVRCITNGTRLERHMRTTGRLDLLVVSYDQTRVEHDPEGTADVRRQLGLRVRCITNGTRLERHMRTTGRLDLLVVSYDQTRVERDPEGTADVRRQLALVAATHPRLTILVNFVLCATDDPLWVADEIDALTERGYNVFVNVDRYFGAGRVDPRIVACLKANKRRTGRVHMTDETLDWLDDTGEPVPFCSPTLLPLLDPRARLIYPCCYHDEQNAGSLLDTGYRELLRRSAERFGHYPFDLCGGCTTTAYLDASVAVRKPITGLRHYHRLYNS